MKFSARLGRSERGRPPIQVPGERVLAWAQGPDGAAAGTRDALVLSRASQAEPVVTRIPWEQVQAADWDQDSSVLRVSEVGHWGEVRPEHRLTLEEPGRLLQLVRERVTASVVLQRHVPVSGRQGVRVIARRAPRGDLPITWFLEYDQGVDPSDPEVRRLTRATLEAAQDEVGPR